MERSLKQAIEEKLEAEGKFQEAMKVNVENRAEIARQQRQMQDLEKQFAEEKDMVEE